MAGLISLNHFAMPYPLLCPGKLGGWNYMHRVFLNNLLLCARISSIAQCCYSASARLLYVFLVRHIDWRLFGPAVWRPVPLLLFIHSPFVGLYVACQFKHPGSVIFIRSAPYLMASRVRRVYIVRVHYTWFEPYEFLNSAVSYHWIHVREYATPPAQVLLGRISNRCWLLAHWRYISCESEPTLACGNLLLRVTHGKHQWTHLHVWSDFSKFHCHVFGPSSIVICMHVLSYPASQAIFQINILRVVTKEAGLEVAITGFDDKPLF